MTAAENAERFRRFAGTEASSLPVYHRVVTAAAADGNLMELMEEAPRGQRRPNLLLAAVHDLLLSGVEHPLARWYPSISGVAPPADEDPFPEFQDLIEQHRGHVARVLATRSTQTNEPNRSCLWRVAVPATTADVDGPIALLEIGASIGLNLCFDRYRYEFDGAAEPAGTLRCELRRPLTVSPVPEIAGRAGLDVAPIAVDDAREVRWVKACIWPEQPERHARFDAAVAAVRDDPPTLVPGDLIDDLGTAIDALPPGCHLVVISSWVLFYVERTRRVAFENALGEVARDRPVTWISAEGPGVVAWAGERDDLAEPHSVVARSRWIDGRHRREVVARCHAHLAWLDWFGDQPK